MEKQIQTSPFRALRAVVLDNDETTGSYGIVFSILTFLSKYPDIYGPQIHSLLAKLAYWMEDHNVFRPGLRRLISTLLTLRKKGQIDLILMYTNQRHEVPTDYEGTSYELLYSAPLAISFMMDVLFSTHVFDSHFTRPKEHWGATAAVPKYFARILDSYPIYPKDTRGILFVDDLATPELILHHGIAITSPESLIRVSQYRVSLDEDQISDLMLLLFGLRWCNDVAFHSIVKQYFSRSPNESSPASPHDFEGLAERITTFYREYNKQSHYTQIKDYPHHLHRTQSDYGRHGETNQTKVRARERSSSVTSATEGGWD